MASSPTRRSGIGAIASQSFVNPYLGIDGLSSSSRAFLPSVLLERLIESDPGRELRQVAIVDKGRTAAYTGERCISWAGHVFGGGYVCLGNILEGEDVVKAMATAFERSQDEDFPNAFSLPLRPARMPEATGAGVNRPGFT